MQYYHCKFCGSKATSISNLTAQPCGRHPLGNNKGKHTLYEGSEKSQYNCKHCGAKATSISNLTAQPCGRHPLGNNKGKHEPAL
jgi:predicted nucleic acid-binding Zn ribbon protein